MALIKIFATLAALGVQYPDFDPLDRVALPMMAVIDLLLVLLLWKTRLPVRWANLTMYLFAAMYLLLAFDHQFRTFAPTWGVMSESTYWFTALNVAAFLIFPGRLAGFFVNLTLMLVAVIGAAHLLTNPLLAGKRQLLGSFTQFFVVLVVTGVMQAQFGAIRDRMLTMRRAAYQDVLTGIGNRRAAEERLSRLQSNSRSYTLVLFDIDHFKDVNDRYGHALGDRVLRDLALYASGFVPQGGNLYRWGGEEFLMILPRTDEAELRGRLNEMRGGLSRLPFEVFEGVTVSVGVADGEPGEPSANVVQRADHAMYFAKHSGRDAIYFAHTDLDPSGRAPA